MNDHVPSLDVKEYLQNFLEDQPLNETNRALRKIYDKNGNLQRRFYGCCTKNLNMKTETVILCISVLLFFI